MEFEIGKREMISNFLTDLASDYKGKGLVRSYALVKEGDLHLYLMLKDTPEKTIHIQAYPGMSSKDSLSIAAHMMDTAILESIQKSGTIPLGNEHDADIANILNLTEVPYDIFEVEKKLAGPKSDDNTGYA